MVEEELIILGSKNEKTASPMFWIIDVIRKVCISPKTVETRGVMKLVVDGINMGRQISTLMKVGL